MLIGLSIANPVRIERRGKPVRVASIVLILLMTIANAASAVLLSTRSCAVPAGYRGRAAAGQRSLDLGHQRHRVRAVVLGVRPGGPVNRSLGTSQHPDLLFTQMAAPELSPPDWEPRFVDYFYLLFTNATAFSPTDVMPMARWAKLTMLVQSAVSLAVGVLVIARAVNILPT